MLDYGRIVQASGCGNPVNTTISGASLPRDFRNHKAETNTRRLLAIWRFAAPDTVRLRGQRSRIRTKPEHVPTGMEQHMAKYANVEEYLGSIADERHRAEFKELLDWVHATWPQLVCEVKWNQPMFMDHGTFIIGFTALTNHVTVGSEPRAFEHAMPLIEQQHLKRGKKTFQIPYERSDAWEVLEQIIEFTIADKHDVQTFWDQRRPGC